MKMTNVMKKIGIGIGIVIGTQVFIANNIFAADLYCYNGVVTRVGLNPALDTNPGSEAGNTTAYYARIMCEDPEHIRPANWPTGDEKEFVLNAALGDGGYATLLTAFSLDQDVRVGVADTIWDSLLNLVDMQKPYVP